MRYKLYEAPELSNTSISKATGADLGKINELNKIRKPEDLAAALKELSETKSIPIQNRYRILRDFLNDNMKLRKGNNFELVRDSLKNMIESSFASKASDADPSGSMKVFTNLISIFKNVDDSLGDKAKAASFWTSMIEAFGWQAINNKNNVFLRMLGDLGRLYKVNENSAFDWKTLQNLYNLYVREEVKLDNNRLNPNISTCLSIAKGNNTRQTNTNNNSSSSLNKLLSGKNKEDVARQLDSMSPEDVKTLNAASSLVINKNGYK